MSKFEFCRLCGSRSISIFLKMEKVPRNVSVMLNSDMVLSDTPTNIEVYKCDDCNFVQLNKTLDDDYYDDYLMTASHTEMLKTYLQEQSGEFIKRFKLNNTKTIDVGCGDGQYVSLLNDKGLIASGIEPSSRFSQKGKKLGLNIYNGYVSKNSPIPGGKYDAFVTRQVLEHVPDPVDFLTGIRLSLNNNAVGIVEMPSVEQALENHRFYDFFPDHLNYFSVNTLSYALEKAGFIVLDIKRTFNGEYLQATVKYDVNTSSHKLQESVSIISNELKDIVNNSTKENKKIVIWGSGAKGLVSLAVADIENHIEFVIDSDETKCGLMTPVTHLNIYTPEKLNEIEVDVVIITALAYKDEILEQLKEEYSFKGDVYILGKHVYKHIL